MSIASDISDFMGWNGEDQDEVSVYVAGMTISGWQNVSIRMGLEVMPSTARIAFTEYQPDGGYTLSVDPGMRCKVLIGTDLVITGYVSVVETDTDSNGNLMEMEIDSLSIDLVECSAEFATYQMSSTNALAICQQVSRPRGVTVTSTQGAGNTDIQQFSVILSETAYEVMERVCRLAGCIFYDQPDGTVLLSPVGATQASGSLEEGKNIEHISTRRSLRGRFSEVRAIIQNPVVLFTPPDSDDYVSQMQAVSDPVNAVATDPGVTRSRPLLIPVELGDADYAVAKQRVQWEVARRYGRSQVIDVVCDSWRDGSGKLWTPNTLVRIKRKSWQIGQIWLIAEVEFVRGEDGSRAQITLMPPEAFKPEPLLLPMQSNEAVAAANSSIGDAGADKTAVQQEDI
ncbi:phage baseplate assembly protein [Acetobacter persici]|uniref:phage baseplate assembly protein n=1 Tax=Acetobacter persici TaxID=1076596 RepID=UPI001BA7F4C2|nr:phage tail protein [Acetobacter persici]MBS1014494.1 phage tail protein [Acetobacter persici]